MQHPSNNTDERERVLAAAQDVFGADVRIGEYSGSRISLLDTELGTVELIEIDPRGFLACANHPPTGSRIDERQLAPALQNHLLTHRLVAWRLVASEALPEAIHELAREAPPVSSPAEEESPPVPYSDPLAPPAGPIVGDERQRLLERTVAYLRAASDDRGAPLLVLAGQEGVGKRSVAAAAASRIGIEARELPLRRLLLDRVLANSAEQLLDSILAARDYEGLLVVSDAELLFSAIPPQLVRTVLAELRRLPCALLSATVGPSGLPPEAVPPAPFPGALTWQCPPLSNNEAADLLAATFPDLTITNPDLLLAGSRAADGIGVLPGRLLFLVRLGWCIDGGDPADISGQFYPDHTAVARTTLEPVARRPPATDETDTENTPTGELP